MKKISVKVIPGAKVEQIQEGMDSNLKIWVKGKPVEGEANRAVIALLAKYYNVSTRDVTIKSGLTARNKIIQIGN